MSNTIVPPGVSGREPKFDARVVNLETVANELALLNLGDFEPLKFKINTRKFMDEIKQFDNDWVEYLPRTDRPNNRQGLVLSNLPGKTHTDNPSLPQASLEAGHRLSENDFTSRMKDLDKSAKIASLAEQRYMTLVLVYTRY